MCVLKLFFILISLSFAQASDYDENLASALKIEANHNMSRLRSYKKEVADNKIFENEREKGLGEFLEEQEKWDLIRERSLQDYRKQKYNMSTIPSREGSVEYRQYLKDKMELERKYKQSQKAHVKTRDKILTKQTKTIAQMEVEEFQLNIRNPRYDLAKRSQNKWISTGGFKSASGIGGSGGSFQNNTQPEVDLSPVPDFPPAPAPYEGFEDVPPPIYDGNTSVPYDPSFGGDLSIPPPPPPPPEYDF